MDIADITQRLRIEFYLEGAVCIEINSIEVLSRNVIDLVDQLWMYLVEGIANLKCDKNFETGYPDQDISISFQRLKNDNVEVSCKIAKDNVKTATVMKDDFCELILRDAQMFFTQMNTLTESNEYIDELKMIDDIKNSNAVEIERKYVYR
jgi:hypothetical protein